MHILHLKIIELDTTGYYECVAQSNNSGIYFARITLQIASKLINNDNVMP